jgi:aryl-alcohol dehydrogenase-like predicted oxidoreductase
MPQNVGLILGTAQFGLDYGITNRDGRVNDDALEAILKHARDRLEWLDTSIKYGDALTRLGRDSARSFSIVTKIDGIDAQTISGEIEESLRRLRRDRLDVVLFHTPTVFDDRQRATEAVAALREEVSRGRVGRIGASLYDGGDVEKVLAVFTPDIVQLPANIADPRLLDDGTALALQKAGIDIHYRSAFLQGLLLSECHQLPAGFDDLASLLVALDGLASRHGITRQQLCMAWVMAMPGARGLVCGVAKLEELDVLIASHTVAATLDLGLELADIARSIVLEDWLLDPRKWPKRA